MDFFEKNEHVRSYSIYKHDTFLKMAFGANFFETILITDTLLFVHSFVCLYVCLLIHSLICSFAWCYFVYSFCLLVCLISCLIAHSFVHLFVHLIVHLFFHLTRCQISCHPILQLCRWLIIHPCLICHCPTNLYCCLICCCMVLWLCWLDLLRPGCTMSVVVSCCWVDSLSQSWCCIAHCHCCVLSLLVVVNVFVCNNCTSALFT